MSVSLIGRHDRAATLSPKQIKPNVREYAVVRASDRAATLPWCVLMALVRARACAPRAYEVKKILEGVPDRHGLRQLPISIRIAGSSRIKYTGEDSRFHPSGIRAYWPEVYISKRVPE
jgi:hypothetical protein